MSRVLIVAWRDFKQTVMRKVFLLAIIGIPFLGVGAMGLAVMVMSRHQEPPLVGTLAIVDPTGATFGPAAIEFDPEHIARAREAQMEAISEMAEDLTGKPVPKDAATGTTRRVGMGMAEVRIRLETREQTDQDTLVELKTRVRNGELLAAAVIPQSVLDIPDTDGDAPTPRYQLYAADDLDADHVSFLERHLGEAIVRARVERNTSGDYDETRAMMRRPSSRTSRVLPSGQESTESELNREIRAQVVPAIFMMLLWIATFTSAQHLMMSTIEEKSNRVMEVLLSAVSPFQLMAGKILGQGGVGLLIVTIYSSLGILSLFALQQMNLIEWSDIAFLMVFFFMAYFMIASIMAAVGSAVSDIREANTLVTPVMLIVMIPLILWMPISQSPNGTLATAFSFIPPAIPFVMILRIAADETVPLWQIPATIVWGYLCVVAMVWMASKIFRVGVLMYGKPPTPVQLLKWLSYS